MAPEFNFLNRLASFQGHVSQQFGIYLTDGEEESEIALGGYNTKKLLTPLKWVPIAKSEMGYWQVFVKEVRVDGKVLPACMDGTCRAIVDSGTSHIGVPGPELRTFVELLSVDSHDPAKDCRRVESVDLEFVLEDGMIVKLAPTDYMRPLSLRAGTNVGKSNGKPVLVGNSTANTTSQVTTSADGQVDVAKPRVCTPRLMPVNLAAPLGPKLFILGEPVLQKYYTAYDAAQKEVGFGLAASNDNKNALGLSTIMHSDAILL